MFARLIFSIALVIASLFVADRAWAAPQAEHPEVHAEHDAAHEIGHGRATENLLRPEEIRSDLALFTFVVFLLLLAILWKFAWGPISAALDRREQTIANHIAEAQRTHDEARQLLAEYERKLASAADRVRELLDEARRDAEHTKQDILAEAKAGAEAERARALRDIEAATDQALKSLAERSADLAVELASKIVQAKLTKDEHLRLIRDAMARFPNGSASPEEEVLTGSV